MEKSSTLFSRVAEKLIQNVNVGVDTRIKATSKTSAFAHESADCGACPIFQGPPLGDEPPMPDDKLQRGTSAP